MDTQNHDHLLVTTRRLLVELQALSSRIAAVHEIATAINRSLNLDQILQVVSQQAKWLLDFEHCSVYLAEVEDQGSFITLFGPSTAQEPLDTTPAGPIKQALRTRQSQLILTSEITGQFPYCSQIVIPLESEGEILGTINFASRQAQAYTQDDLRIGYLMALQLGVAIRNARRFTEINQLYSKLEQAYTDLRQAEAWRNDMTHMIVHDLRNPLNVIFSNLELIELRGDDPAHAPARRRYLTSARSAVFNMVGLIDDILNVAKIDAGELHPFLTPLDFLKLLATREADYHLQAEQEGKSLEIHTPTELPPVLADARLMSRVVDNLVGNAFKYTLSKGRIEIKVALVDQVLQVQIYDDGQGIPPEYHERIFDKFMQVADATGASLRKGIGLGLAFCRLVVEAHGGQIWVESAPDQGSTFTFTLPVCQS